MSRRKISSEDEMLVRRGRLLVVSAPSGSGKTTLVQAVTVQTPGVTRAVTYTTRPKRSGEKEGRDYYFISPAEFERRRLQGEFLEWALVHGYLYGTSRLEVARLCERGLDVFLVIDYQGAASLRRQEVAAIYIFVLPPSMAELERRMRERNSEDEANLRTRLAIAPQEMVHYQHYDYVIVNDHLEVATRRLQAIVLADRCRVERINRRYPIFAELGGWKHE